MKGTLQKYTIDPSHTSVEFLVRHMMLAKVRGRFTGVSGSFAVPQDGTLPTEIAAQIDATSIDTRDEQRDAHLKSADFLDVANFPKIEFVSTKAEGSGEDIKLHGTLTIHGVSRPVVLEGVFEGRATDPWGNARIGFTAHCTISRKDFALTWNQALETGGVLVGDDVRIELNVEGIAQK